MIPMPASAISAPSGLKSGVIRFVDPANPGAKNYLSRTLPAQGYINFSQTKGDAIIVEYDSYGTSNAITIKV